MKYNANEFGLPAKSSSSRDCLRLTCLYIVCLWLFSPKQSLGQYEQVWTFGSGCALDFNNPGPLMMPSKMEGHGEAQASVCDDNGQLLFYTNGFKVWDRNGNLMPNGNGLINDPVLAPTPSDFISSTSQGALIIPWPEKKGKYYIFSMTAFEAGVNIGRLYYSVIDMSLNGGMGDVQPMAKGVFIASGFTEHMTGVVGNRCNVWLLVIDDQQNQLIAFSINSEGIDTSSRVSSPLLPLNYYSAIGQMDVSPDRTKLAIPRAGICLYDFDPFTGIAKGKVALYYISSLAYNVCFSPDNSKLYASLIPLFGVVHTCFQFDLNASDSLAIINSRYTMPQAVTRFKRGPDGKIYTIGSLNDVASIGVVRQPNLPGPSSLFEMINLPGSGCDGNSFPGFPHVVPAIHYDTFYTRQAITAPCFTNKVTISAQDQNTGWEYSWNTGDNGPSLTIDRPGIYWVNYHTPPCNYHADTFIVSFPYGVLPSLHIDTSCKKRTNGGAHATTYIGDTINYTYTWMNILGDTLSVGDTLSGVPSGNYTVHIHTLHCDTILPFFLPGAEYKVSFLSDSIICMGNSLNFRNTSAAQFKTFLWSFGDGANAFVRSPPAHAYLQPGSYEVTLTGSGSICNDTSSQTITVDSMMSGTFLIDRDNICTGQSIIFTPQVDYTAPKLSWQWGDGNETTSPNNLIQHAYDREGILPVKMTTHFRACPETSFMDTVYIYPLPKISLGPDSILCLNGAPILLQNSLQLPTGSYRQLWSTGEIGKSISVVEPGIYSLTLSREPLGCSATESITVVKDCYIDLPNTFTPNNDGINDYFFPRQLLSKGITKFHMQIFNRWGQLIFETNRTDGHGWDGNFNGAKQPEGVYLYLLSVEIKGIPPQHYKGNVTLLR